MQYQKPRKQRLWTREENIIILKADKTLELTELAKLLPDRSIKAVKKQAERQGVKLISWCEEG